MIVQMPFCQCFFTFKKSIAFFQKWLYKIVIIMDGGILIGDERVFGTMTYK